MATRPPRVTSTSRQRTTRGGPVVTRRAGQRTTGHVVGLTGRVTGSTFAGPAPKLNTGGGTAAVGGVPSSSVQAPQYSTSNLPPDASYDAAVALLQRQRDEQFASITAERARTLSDYGFQEGPNGMLTFDPNNPFSKSAVMKKTFDTNHRSTGQSMASGGQLYAGSYQNAQDLINRNQVQSEDALQKNLQAFLARNTGQRAEAGTGYETAAGQAYSDRIGRFQTNPLYDPASSAEPPPGAMTPAQVAASAASPPRGGSSRISGAENIPAYKTVNGKIYRKTASGKWMPVN